MSSVKDLRKKVSMTYEKAKTDLINGVHPAHVSFGSINSPPPSLVGTGAAVYLDQNHANSVTPDTRNIISMSPEATVLVKKKAFSSLKSSNDIRFMDKTEKMLLRATKALFAFKVQQIRAYESLTKFENFLADNSMYSMNLLSSFIREASLLNLEKLSYTAEEYAEMRLQQWLDEEMDVYLQTDDGPISYSLEAGQFINESSPGILEIAFRQGNPVTNREYVNALSASQAKATLDGKRNDFIAEYLGTDGSGSAIDGANKNLNKSLSMEGNDFFSDLGDVLSFSTSAEQYNAMNEDLARIIKRNAFSVDNQLTTWIVDPESPDNYTLGPGTGVIEVAIFDSFNTSTDYKSNPSSASMSISYPYRLGTILEDDIEAAINEALYGTVGILDEMLSGGLKSEGLSGSMPPIDGASIISAALELGGAGSADSSLDTDYIRDRLRTFYLGKPFINPPDPVHFYIRGNRTYTDYTSVGSPYSEDISESPFDMGHLQLDNVILKAEYQLYTTQSIGFDNYKEIRKRQDNSFGMIHVFGGYVTQTSESFSGGFWNLKISCTDNMSWLSWSQFAIQPSLSDPKNILEDPLTPFEMIKDDLGQIVGSQRDLLYENKQLLQTGLLSYDSGLFAGQNATEGNLLQGQYSGIGSLSGKKVMQHPSGFIYRWKAGIITATAGFQVVDPTGENQASQRQYSQQYAVTAAQDVLNNLDIPNILSILIVGQPYNIETFIEQSFAAHNKGDNKTSKFSPDDPLTGVVEAVRKQNEYFGNFHPYRMLSVSSASAEQMINQAGIREMANSSVKILQTRKVRLRKKIRQLQVSASSNINPTSIPSSALIATLQSEIDTIDAGIQAQIRAGNKANSALTSADEVGIEISLTGPSINLPISSDEDESHDVTRAMMMVGAQRKIEDVRLNRDRNLFIVSDQYDTADIRPFILNLNKNGWSLFNSTYVDVYQKCSAATNMLNLEFFCNSQGHLEFRPPLWNRVPLSILKQVIQTQEETGKVIMPSFITSLFQTRVEGLYLEIHTLNVKIVLLSLMMGRYPDSTLIPNMQFSGAASLRFFGVEAPEVSTTIMGKLSNALSGGASNNGGLRLIQTEFESSAGNITEQNNSLFGDGLNITTSFQDKGDILAGDTETLLGIFDPIFQEEKGIVDDVLTASRGGGGVKKIMPPASRLATIDNLEAVRGSFKRQFGRDPANGTGIDLKRGFHISDLVHLIEDQNKLEDQLLGANGVLQRLNKAISTRDSYVSMLQANLAKQQELDEIAGLFSGEEDDGIEVADGVIKGKAVEFLEKSATSLQSAADIITGKVAEGTVYDHLIEDDTRNLLGYGSGKRFILKDEYIMNATFTETPPEFTRIDVKGSAPLGLDAGLNKGTDSLYFWAGGTDFDLWRQYGYKPSSIELPFVSDVEGQARPYAILELVMQKMNINKGSVSIAGNEFYQPGDTVYVPCKGLLYYIESVTHTFSYRGTSFTTNLSLIYGHPPGQYVSSPLDVIGQQLVGNFLEDPSLVYRTSDSDDNYRTLKPDSTFVFPSGGAGMAQLLSYKDNQIRFTNMMIDLSGSLMGTRYVLIRGFVRHQDDFDAIKKVNKKMAVVRSLLENPSQISQSHQYSGGDDLLDGVGQALTSIGSLFGGGSTGTTKGLTNMRLPNNLPVTPIGPDKIIEQISYLNRDDDANPAGEIKCLDRRLAAAFISDAGSINQDKAIGIFPKGGPSQGSWLDFRDEIIGVNFVGEINVIEVGIIDVPNSVVNQTT